MGPIQYKNILIITDMVIEPFLDTKLKKLFSEIGISTRTNYVNYTEFISPEKVSFFEQADIIVVWLYFSMEDYVVNTKKTKSKHIIDSYATLYKYITDNNKNGKVIWFGIDSFFNNFNCVFGNTYIPLMDTEKIKIELSNILGDTGVLINTERLVAINGIDNTYSMKSFLRWNCPYKEGFFILIAQEILKQYKIWLGLTPKCIVLDCDNVLWGGVISEDGIENIKIGGNGSGKKYQEFQKFLLGIHNMGVILTICSKNDEDDVLKVFHNHSAMILKEEHFACFQINWNAKPNNIMQISEKLGISLDSMIFIDDSIFEIESVKSLLPQVNCVMFEKDSIFKKLSCFNLNYITDNESVLLRNNTYRTNIYREKLKASHINIDEYLTSLNQVIDIKEASETEIYRIAELTQRCNRCTNGVRYNMNQIKDKLHSNSYKIYVVYVSDIFGDLGLVGVMGIEKKKSTSNVKSEVLDLFCLSCRVLERKIEECMIDFMTSFHTIGKINYVDTSKNQYILKKLQKNIKLGEENEEKSHNQK